MGYGEGDIEQQPVVVFYYSSKHSQMTDNRYMHRGDAATVSEITTDLLHATIRYHAWSAMPNLKMFNSSAQVARLYVRRVRVFPLRSAIK